MMEAFMQSQRSVEVGPDYLDVDVRQLVLHWNSHIHTFGFDVIYANSNGNISVKQGGLYRNEIPTLCELGRRVLDFFPYGFFPPEIASQLAAIRAESTSLNRRSRPLAAFMS